MTESQPVALHAQRVAERTTASHYPAPHAARMHGRVKRALGDAFGLAGFGVNLTTLLPGAMSALRHHHSRQDEFIYVLEGHPVLVTDAGRTQLSPGMCAGFRAGDGNGHHLLNPSAAPVLYLEVGDRSEGDVVGYPDDDLVAVRDGGRWRFAHRDGTPW
ncbi:cupin domain-containing protein [Luteimonas sp. SDU82]|uniref:cupin domain-containing protein n=1 Tax=Luteimonas sp. SDU82 TaxID=3422592 RepID=UPI003EBACBE4